MWYNTDVPKGEQKGKPMDISKCELQSVVKTLPIGLYIKRGLVVSIGDEDTSYYSPHTDEIVVSCPQIQLALSKIADDSPHKERVIRSVLYHEVSHAFITPDMQWNDIINVFEDERMETLLANYYHDVDFKTNVFLFNGLAVGEIPTATNKFQEFYNLVRFRSGRPDLLKKVEEIIQKYAHFNRTTSRYDSWDYYNAIMELYGEMQNPSTDCEFQGDVQQTEGNQPCEGEQDGEIQNGTPNKGQSALSPEQIHAMFDQVVNDKTTNELTTTFQAIIDGFNKRNRGGSSIGGYSGVLNPRSANREDYKIFDRPFTQKSNNQFGTCHLNLFIDKSGSFCNSQDLVNKLLVALSAIERRNPNFTVDVVFCGYTEYIAETPKDRVLHCSGGNDLDNKIFDIYRSLQKPNTFNYNIVLFDGDAFSSGSHSHYKNFRAFDFNNCTIISDEENRRYIEKTVKKAKVIYTKKYTEELLVNIKNTLARAFR